MAGAPPPSRPEDGGGSDRPPREPGSEPPPRPRGRPEYKVYRSRSGPRIGDRLTELRRRAAAALPGRPGRRAPSRRPPRPGPARPPAESGRRLLTVKRVILGVVALIAGWIALSVVLFVISAQTAPGVSAETREALSTGGTLLTGSTILVLGTDQREVPGQQGEVGRADSIMLLHVGFGSVRRLSLLRDSRAEIPGHTAQKLNASYAFGGAPLTIETVEGFLGNGIEINHVIEVNFKEFPRFIDAIGGVTVDNKSELKAPFFDKAVRAPAECAPGGGGENGEIPSEGFRMAKGSCHLDGDQALTYARIRQNLADPGESDDERAARQQAVLSGIRGQLTTPGAFLRLPWIAWAAPRTIRTDLRGLGMTLLAIDLLTGGAGKSEVLGDPASTVPGTSDIAVSEVEKAEAVEKLLAGG
jgi:anionic cell wall polymer biosynthesis LytR-Cps2A-Psr (LCP) family protein